jgi:integrase
MSALIPKKPTGRPRTGSVVEHGDHFDARVTLPNGKRVRRCLPAGLTEARARETAAAMTERAIGRAVEEAKKIAAAPPITPAEETIEAWISRWCDAREARGLTSVRHDRGRLGKWVIPVLRGRAMAKVTKLELVALVEDLDAHVQADDLSWKTATNVWGNITKMFFDACQSKTIALRVRADNPTDGVAGPDKGAKKAKAYLYPSEFLALVSSPRTPLRWARLFVAAVYTYTRAGELEALGTEDINRERGSIHIHRSINRAVTGRGPEKATKTKHARRIPVEATFAPLLGAMIDEVGRGRLLAMPALCDLSDRLRQYLRWAGVTRAELFANDKTRKQITFHDLRATGITWMAIRGDDHLRIQARAGHASFSTTQGYIREAENLDGVISASEVFPALPPHILAKTSGHGPGNAGLGGDEADGSEGDEVQMSAESCVVDTAESSTVAAVAGSNPAGDANRPALAGRSAVSIASSPSSPSIL